MAVGHQTGTVIVQNWATIQTTEFYHALSASSRRLLIDQRYIMAMYLVTRAHTVRFTFIPDSSVIQKRNNNKIYAYKLRQSVHVGN